jgi:hypothetical protein
VIDSLLATRYLPNRGKGDLFFLSIGAGCAKLAPSQILLLENTMHSKTSIALTLLACTLPAHGDGTAPAQYKTGTLTVDVSGPDVSMQLRLAMTRATTSSESKQTLLTPAEVVARLKEAAKLFVFPDKAKCQVESANAFAVDSTGKPTTADGNIQAMYRFRCDGATSARIDKLGIRLSDQLPGLEKLKLQVATDKGEIAQELSPANGDVTL